MKQSMRVSRAISVLFTVVVFEYSHFCIITHSKNQFRIKLFRTNRTNSEQNNLISDAVDERRFLSLKALSYRDWANRPKGRFCCNFFPKLHRFLCSECFNGQKITPNMRHFLFHATAYCDWRLHFKYFSSSKFKKKPTKPIYRIEKFKVIVTVPSGIF